MSSKVLYIHKKEVSYESRKRTNFFRVAERGEAIPLEEVIAKLNSTN